MAEWQLYWTTGRHGQAGWPTAAAELKRRTWQGNICLTAEYSDTASADRLIVEDLAFLKPMIVG